MRIAIVSDIHGNRTALEAVIEDLGNAAPDVVFHGGDLADNGSSGEFVVDRVRELGWAGVGGNTDEMLWRPEALAEFLKSHPHLRPIFAAMQVEEMAAAVRERLGEKCLEWLRCLPPEQKCGPMALVHASPGNCWQAPGSTAETAELDAVYGPLGRPVAVYGHIHTAYIRRVGEFAVANAGSVGMPYDGDPRAAYLLITDGAPEVRRVAYDVEREIVALKSWAPRQAERMGAILRSGRA